MRAGVVMLMLAVVSCSSPVSPSADLRVETTMSTTTVRPGDAVTVSIVLSNHGALPHRVYADVCPDPFVVTRADGTVVGPAERLCALISPLMVDLAPGESYTITVPWTGDARAGMLQIPPPVLPAGAYRLQARIMTQGGIVVEGTPVEIHVVP